MNLQETFFLVVGLVVLVGVVAAWVKIRDLTEQIEHLRTKLADKPDRDDLFRLRTQQFKMQEEHMGLQEDHNLLVTHLGLELVQVPKSRSYRAAEPSALAQGEHGE